MIRAFKLGEAVAQGRTVQLRIVLALFAAAGILQNCAKERSTNPVIPRSRIYVTVENNPPPPTLLIFDADADSLIDSLNPPIAGFSANVTCDQTQSRFIVSRNSTVWVYTDGGAAFLGQYSTRSGYFAFSAQQNELIGATGSYGGVVAPNLQILNASDMTVKFEDTIALSTHVEIDNQRGIFYGISRFEDTPGAFPSRSILCGYDIRHREFHDCWAPAATSVPEEFYVWSYCISPDGAFAFLLATVSNGTWLVGLELATKKILFESIEHEPSGTPRVTPDGSQVWLPIGGDGAPSEVDRIRIYDASSGVLLSTIDLHDWRFGPNTAVKPRELRFTPDGNKAYLRCSQFGGPIMVIDTKTHHVLKVWYTDIAAPRVHRPLSIDIGPSP